MTMVDDTTAVLMGRIIILEELARWLSLTFLPENEPIFAGATGEGTMNGQPLGQAPQLHALWHQVTGTAHTDGPRSDAVWVPCPECGHYSVRSSDGT